MGYCWPRVPNGQLRPDCLWLKAVPLVPPPDMLLASGRFSVAICPVSAATQYYPPPAPPELSRNLLRPACGAVGSCSI